MQRVVDTSLDEVDGVCLVLAADEQIGAGDRLRCRARVFGGAAPVVIALNKVDRLRPAEIARQIELAAALGDFHALHPVSASNGRRRRRRCATSSSTLLPEGPLYFPRETLTDLPLELRIAELFREQALELTREEVPHAVTVEVEEIDRRRVAARCSSRRGRRSRSSSGRAAA